MTDPSRLWLFVIASVALTVTPGPNVLYIVTRGIGQGRRAAVTSALGVDSALLIHVAASAMGVSAIVASSATAFTTIRWIGAIYLLGLGVQAWRSDGLSVTRPVLPARHRHLFRQGFVVSLLNVKVALFFLAFLPQFVDPEAAMPALQILCLGLWFDLVGTLVNIVIALVAAGTAARLRHVAWLGRAARWLAATAMGGLALQLAFSGRR